ncbi:Aste57867_16424 [Aphanomyces stellatus]|uniref:Aste57867_16424 protein n=1 Tax=Aphanomyces stellatus TaxID=120398 RepID=A0A485L8M5_9STRA|nr:hypothetical protein As57867_016367 [Aphanomyces stellatus]VFT93199.1 Aste57867_16424 [Aphanomyces stellatus]
MMVPSSMANDGSGSMGGGGTRISMRMGKSPSLQRILPLSAGAGTFKALREMAERPSILLRRLGSDKTMPIEGSSKKGPRKKSNKGGSAVRVVPFAPERLSIVSTMRAHDAMLSSSSMEPSMKATAGIMLASAKLHSQLARTRKRETDPHFRKKLEAKTREKVALRHKNVLDHYKIRRHSVPVKAGHGSGVDDDVYSSPYYHTSSRLIYPNATWYKCWQVVALVIVLYQAYAIPFSLAFLRTHATNPNDDTFYIASSVFLCLDVLLQFNTIARDPAYPDTFITSRRYIAKTYLTGWFVWDVLSAVPFDVIIFNTVGATAFSHSQGVELLRGLRLPRFLRVMQLGNMLRLLRVSPEWAQWLLYSRYSHLIRLGSLIGLFLTLTHVVACIWHGLVAKPDWIDELFGSSDADTVDDYYVISIYVSLMAMLGQSLGIHSTRYFFFASIMTVLGSLVMAIVFGNVADLLANFYENNNTYKRKIESLFTSMDLMKLPTELQHRVNEYYQTMWNRYGTLDGTTNQFMRELSRNLAKEVELFLRMDMINNAPFFAGCTKKFVEEVVMLLQLQVFLVGDYVIVRGEVGHDMYFVQSGICEVTKGTSGDRMDATLSSSKLPVAHEEEMVLKTLSQGDYFGEISLLMNCKRTANVRAQTFVELCALSRDDFDEISGRYVEDRSSIEKFITEKYDEKLLEEVLRQQEANQAAMAAKEEHDHIAANFQRVFDHLSLLEGRLEVVQQAQQQMLHGAPNADVTLTRNATKSQLSFDPFDGPSTVMATTAHLPPTDGAAMGPSMPALTRPHPFQDESMMAGSVLHLDAVRE